MDDLCAVVVSSDTDYVQVCGVTTTLHIVDGSIYITVFNTRARREWFGFGNAPNPGASLGLKSSLRAGYTTLVLRPVRLGLRIEG